MHCAARDGNIGARNAGSRRQGCLPVGAVANGVNQRESRGQNQATRVQGCKGRILYIYLKYLHGALKIVCKWGFILLGVLDPVMIGRGGGVDLFEGSVHIRLHLRSKWGPHAHGPTYP